MNWDTIAIDLPGFNGTIAAGKLLILMRGMTKYRTPIHRLLVIFFGVSFSCAVFVGVYAARFEVENIQAGQGEAFTLEVRVFEFAAVQALQFSLRWDPDVVKVVDVSQFGLPGMNSNDFGLFQSEGRLSVIWDAPDLNGETLQDGAALFHVSFLSQAQEGHSTIVDFVNVPTEKLVVQNLERGEFESTPGTISIGLPPLIMGVTELAIAEDEIPAPVPFVFLDDSTPATELETTVVSHNEILVPNENLALVGDGRDRNLMITPTANESGRAEIEIRAMDQSGAVGLHRLLITVLSVNDPPMAVDDRISIVEDSGPVTIDVLANDTVFPDIGDEVYLDSIELPDTGASIEVLEDGRLIYEPFQDFSGLDEIRYQVRDRFGLTDTASLFVSVESVNDPPLAVDDALTIPEDRGEIRVPVLENDSIAPDSGEILTVVSATSAASGAVVEVRDGIVFYQAPLNYFGDDSFRYSVKDGNGGISEGTVSILVTPVNDPPRAIDDGVSVPEDSRDVFIDVLANDDFAPDTGEMLTIESVNSGTSGGETRIEADGLRYSSPPNFFGVETFEYSIGDGNQGRSTGLVTVTVVNDRADAPVARDDRFTIAEDSPASFLPVLDDNGAGQDFDPDGDELSIIEVVSLNENAGQVEISSAGLGLTYTPAENFVGSETLSYVITDGELTGTGFVFITVSNANNDPPLAFDDVLQVAEDTILNQLNVLADNGFGMDRDPEGVPLTVMLVPGVAPQHGAVAVSDDGMALLYSPKKDFSGIDRFPYIVSDGATQSRAFVSVAVINGDNDPPLAIQDELTAIEDEEEQVLDVLADNGDGADSDPEGAELRIVEVAFESENLGGVLRVSDDGQLVFYSPPANFIGRESLSYTVTDGVHQARGRASVLVVNADNDPPVALDDHFTVCLLYTSPSPRD